MFSSPVLPCLLAASLFQVAFGSKDLTTKAGATDTTTPKNGVPSILKVSTLMHPPYFYNNSNGKWSGFLMEVMIKLKNELHFEEFQVIKEKDRFNDFSRSDEWEEVIDDVVSGKADMGLASLTMTPSRMEKVEFSAPLLHFGFAVVRRTPEHKFEVRRSVFFCLAPFSSGVWACVIILLFATVALLTANAARNPQERAQRMNRGEMGPANSEEPLSLRDHISQSFWFVLSSTALQSGARQPMSIAGRVLAISWWLFAGLTVATYIAALLMDIVASSGYQAPPFTTVSQLMESWLSNPGYRVFFQHDAVRQKFKKNTQSLFQFLYVHSEEVKDDATKAPKGSLAWVEAMLKDSDRNLIVMGSESTQELVKMMDCGSVMTTEFLDDRYVGLVFPRRSTKLRVAVNQALLKMSRNGQIRELVRKYGLQGRGKCGLGFDRSDPMRDIRQVLLTEAVSEAVRGVAEMFYDSLPISMRHFAGILVLYIVGLIFGLCGLALDIYIYTHPEGFKHNDQILTVPDPRDEILDTPEIQGLNEA